MGNGLLGAFSTSFQLVPASSSWQVLESPNGAGSQGDIISELVIIPATTTPGTVQIRDSSTGTAITIFVGGTISDIKPFVVLLGIRSRVGPWAVNTGASVSVLAVGNFT
jgi:hypothetical protein